MSTLQEAMSMRVNLAMNIDDRPEDIETFLERTCEIWENTGGRKWTLSLRGCQYLGPYVASLLACLHAEGERLNQSPHIVLPEEPKQLNAFCVFSGMEKMFSDGKPPEPDHPECETLPISHFERSDWGFPNALMNLIRRHNPELSEEVEESLRLAIAEITQNVKDHANSLIGGYMCARYMSGSKQIRVGIADRGVGVWGSLRKQYPEIVDSQDALRRVVRGNYSAKSRPNNMGQGVCNLFLHVPVVGGTIAMISGDAIASASNQNSQPQVRGMRARYPGTAIFMTLPA